MIVSTQNMIDRVRRAYYNDFPNDQSVLSDNEILLHINDVVAQVATKQANDAYTITGIVNVPDGYLTTFKITSFTRDADTGYYYSSLPHPPLGLVQNSGVNSVFFTGIKGQSRPVLYVSANEVDYFRNMAHPPNAAYYWIEGGTLFMWVKSMLPTGTKVSVRMATHVTSNLDASINVPPDAVGMVFDLVMQKLLQRKSIPQDNLTDGVEKA
jgi:hypothetical protein